MRCRTFTIDRVLEWVEKYKNIDWRFCFFEVYACFSPLYQQIGKRLLSMKTVGSMDVERTAKPFKHCMLNKDRNRLSDERGVLCSGLGRISSISIMQGNLSKERCTQEFLFLVWTVQLRPWSARQRSLVKFLIKKQCECARLWIMCLCLVIIVCLLCCTSCAASAVGGKGSCWPLL
jgi:hypothetical protein